MFDLDYTRNYIIHVCNMHCRHTVGIAKDSNQINIFDIFNKALIRLPSTVVYKCVHSYQMSFAGVVSPPLVRMGECGGNQSDSPVVKLFLNPAS